MSVVSTTAVAHAALCDLQARRGRASLARAVPDLMAEALRHPEAVATAQREWRPTLGTPVRVPSGVVDELARLLGVTRPGHALHILARAAGYGVPAPPVRDAEATKRAFFASVERAAKGGQA